jgi:alpha 1,2-mannosyltransferase
MIISFNRRLKFLCLSIIGLIIITLLISINSTITNDIHEILPQSVTKVFDENKNNNDNNNIDNNNNKNDNDSDNDKEVNNEISVDVDPNKLIKIDNDDGKINIPDPINDSSYAMDETTNDRVKDEQINDIIQEIKNEESERENINPANPNKDWSIKINNKKLEKLKSTDLIKGNSIIKDFFTKIIKLIHGNRLSFPLEQRMKMENGKTIIDPVRFFSRVNDNLSERKLKSLFHFPEDFLEDATIKHKIVTDNLPDIKPNFYSGSGYVIVGGGKYSWFALLVIETLKKLGSTLPIEVIIPTISDYESLFCEKILPNYNAKCINIYDIFDPILLEKIKVTGYQYKSLALLASSFENAFLLDADNYPIMNPDLLFESELYKNYSMITWPDYWRRTTSPFFYDITGKTIGKRVRYLNDFKTDVQHFKSYVKVNNQDIAETESYLRNKIQFHDREGTIPEWTTESGEMLINKKIHFKALLLALYYNLEGQFGFYPLLSQGGAGEGDKETFVAASNFFGLNYYQVNKMPDRAYGFYKYRSMYVDTSIIQYNPLKDNEILQQVHKDIEMDIEAKGDKFHYIYVKMFYDKFSIEKSEPMFYHVHETKMDPFELVEIRATEDLNGKKIRNLGGDFPRFDFDLELFLWEKINYHLCIEKSNLKFLKSKGEEEVSRVCDEFMESQLDFLRQTDSVVREQYNPDDPFGNLKRAENLLPAIDEAETSEQKTSEQETSEQETSEQGPTEQGPTEQGPTKQET